MPLVKNRADKLAFPYRRWTSTRKINGCNQPMRRVTRLLYRGRPGRFGWFSRACWAARGNEADKRVLTEEGGVSMARVDRPIAPA
jgi:hypothetical protein